MRMIKLPSGTHIPFMKWRAIAISISIITAIGSVVLFATVGMNFGIDFRGGTVVELRFKEPVPIAEIRREVGELSLGDVQIVEFGASTDVLIRVAEQPGGDEAQQAVVIALREMFEDRAEFRRVEVVGPRVSSELTRNGIIGVLAALAAIMVYIWFRFEWQFAIGAGLTTLHDVILTIGLYSLTQLEFNLTSIAAVLTIVGYSLNDTVIVYDRLRENLRRYKRMPLPELIDTSINEMLSRTVMTSLTTVLALVGLVTFGGEVIRSFTIAMIFGVAVGTFSSIFVAAPILIGLNLRPQKKGGDKDAADTGDADDTAAAKA
jgi:preprotein translocase SecF subunit